MCTYFCLENIYVSFNFQLTAMKMKTNVCTIIGTYRALPEAGQERSVLRHSFPPFHFCPLLTGS